MHEGDNRTWSERYLEDGTVWADLEAAADLLEQTKSAVLAQWCSELGAGVAVNKAELTIKASPKWRDHVSKIVEARRKANIAKVQVEYDKMKHHEGQSKDANARAELRTLGSVT